MHSDNNRLIDVNRRQAAFYDQFHTERALNTPSRLWRRFRRHIKSIADVDDRVEAFERDVFEEVRPRLLLEVGCYAGRPQTLSLIQQPWLERYVGLELSAEAIRRFHSKLHHPRAAEVELVVGDFATLDLPAESFDAVYMHGVFHHFPDPAFAVQRIVDLLKPGGSFITFDPLLTNSLFRAARAVYRPFQSDREWEWPLQRGTFDTLGKHLQLRRLQGYLGMEMYGAIAKAVLPVPAARAFADWTRDVDKRHADRIGPGLFRCNSVTMWWQKGALAGEGRISFDVDSLERREPVRKAAE
jgi:SAM-dependent methyltransferase